VLQSTERQILIQVEVEVK